MRALTEQIGRIMHSSNLFQMPLQEQAADRIAAITGLDEVFFCNSGLEANEAAIKVARKYGHDRGVAEPAIIVMEKAFHGRSLATLSATGSRKVQAGFEPLVQGFVRVPLNDLDAVRQVAAHNKNVVAVFVEPIQGEGGINVSRLDYLRGLKEICDAERLAVHVRRGAVRPRAHRQVVRLPARRLPARRGAARQGPRRRRAGRRLRGRRPREGRVQAGQPRLDLRRQPARDVRRGDHPRHDEGGRPAGKRARKSAQRCSTA